jgi:hypothetical protein
MHGGVRRIAEDGVRGRRRLHHGGSDGGLCGRKRLRFRIATVRAIVFAVLGAYGVVCRAAARSGAIVCRNRAIVCRNRAIIRGSRAVVRVGRLAAVARSAR